VSRALRRWAVRCGVLLIATALPGLPAAEDAAGPAPPARLTDLAAAADLVALVQVRDTDYLTRRDIPVSGSAFLQVLIPYKSDRPADLVEVYEKGLHDNECYFPNPTVFEEGRRYLLFARRDPEDAERYLGLPQGCALEVLVAGDNRYALRYPPGGIALADPLEALAEPMAFADRYALVDDEALPPAERNALRDAGHIEDAGDGRWRYTRGVDLTTVRRLIDPEALAD
jgi:hypothetical protein